MALQRCSIVWTKREKTVSMKKRLRNSLKNVFCLPLIDVIAVTGERTKKNEKKNMLNSVMKGAQMSLKLDKIGKQMLIFFPFPCSSRQNKQKSVQDEK